MTANKITNEGIVTQLAVVHTMLPKVKELIDQQAQEIESLKSATIPYKDLHQVVKNVLAHPICELTDEEIENAYWSLVGKQHEGKIASYLYNFAKAILKKASEK